MQVLELIRNKVSYTLLTSVTKLSMSYLDWYLNRKIQIIWLACISNFEGFKYSKNKWNIANSLVICLKFKLETFNFFMYSNTCFFAFIHIDVPWKQCQKFCNQSFICTLIPACTSKHYKTLKQLSSFVQFLYVCVSGICLTSVIKSFGSIFKMFMKNKIED